MEQHIQSESQRIVNAKDLKSVRVYIIGCGAKCFAFSNVGNCFENTNELRGENCCGEKNVVGLSQDLKKLFEVRTEPSILVLSIECDRRRRCVEV